MSEMKHTAGPWRADKLRYPGSISICTDESEPWVIAEICSGAGYHGDLHDEPNARLIAAAPDLLEALTELVRIRDWCAQAGGAEGPLPQDVIHQFALMQIPAIDAARAAIAKAEGR